MKSTMDDGVAIVTGGGTGIGAATVRRLAARGVRCVINYATSRDAADALAAETGGLAVRADVTDDAACRRLVASGVERFGRVDFLVNNAGRTKFVPHEDMDALSADDFLDIYRLNTVAAFQMVRACAPAMRGSGMGAVVNVSSVAGVFGHGSSVAYAASKGAMITMTKSLARALAPAIRVNAVAPGYVGTNWGGTREADPAKFEAVARQVAASVPLAIAGQAEDIAGPIEMLLDPATRLITGETWLVDAGANLDIDLSRRPGREMF